MHNISLLIPRDFQIRTVTTNIIQGIMGKQTKKYSGHIVLFLILVEMFMGAVAFEQLLWMGETLAPGIIK